MADSVHCSPLGYKYQWPARDINVTAYSSRSGRLSISSTYHNIIRARNICLSTSEKSAEKQFRQRFVMESLPDAR